ncbi:DUF4178 domain-containing protein [Sphingomonas sp. BN140010]|uniref:DUF4178 domain-containing protein n=1 Tax=Sphingomonas arvum TaxID=2992113 RepID=A0ABT3JCW8_9SPHN|nr:DUF4178 domain-containing protein [Sphingomonas sp. BN140010]MCW3796874.1 DUF4178 domain-containing protein [Sphingomonas sp. BN140010]
MTAARVINCPNCGGSIALKAAGYSISVACQYCGSELDVANPDVLLITEYHRAAAASDLPLGARGTVKGIEREVVGWLQRSDGEARWSEYLLFNPYAGYCWLIHADGEWSLGTMLTAEPVALGEETVEHEGECFHREYDPVPTRTDAVVGEFYWRVRAGDTVEATVYSDGNASLSWERSADEVNWTLLEPLPSCGAVPAAFVAGQAPRGPSGPPGGPPQFGRKQGSVPRASSVPATDLTPVARRSDAGDLSAMLGMAVATCFLIALVAMMFGAGGRPVSQGLTIYTGQPAQTATLATLTLNRPYQAVTVTARGDAFVNKWVDLDYRLVDRRTQRSIDAYGLMEYYAGRDSDGPWTEGSHQRVTKFAAVPAGTYDLMVEASAQNWSNPSVTSYGWGSASGATGESESVALRFEVKPGGVFLGNILLFVLLTFAPITIWIVRRVHAAAGGYRS